METAVVSLFMPQPPTVLLPGMHPEPHCRSVAVELSVLVENTGGPPFPPSTTLCPSLQEFTSAPALIRSSLYRWVPLNPNKQHQVKFFQIKQISNQAHIIALWRLRCSFQGTWTNYSGIQVKREVPVFCSHNDENALRSAQMPP